MFKKIYRLPQSDADLPRATSQLYAKKARFDEEIKKNMSVRSRLAVVIGPCSADNPQAVCDYAQKLYDLQQKYTNLLIVMRVYTTKPHTDGCGFKGLCFQPAEDAPCDIASGISVCREIMMRVLQIGLPVADELLYPELYRYFSDLVSYWFVGARSSEDMLHRGFASGLDLPCGIKNPTNGLIDFAVNSLNAVSESCVFPFDGAQIETNGNPFAHVVLRGGSDSGGFFSNITSADTAKYKLLLKKRGLNDFLMADLSHANSGKVAQNQLKNAETVSRDKNIDGVMAESYLFAGVAPDSYGVSKTDDCLDIDNTAKLLNILSCGFQSRNTV